MAAPNTSTRLPALPWVRLAYPHLFEPRAIVSKGVETGAPRFSANLHLDNTPAEYIQMIQQAVINAYVSKWPDPTRRPPLQATVGGDPRLWTNKLPGYLRTPLVWGPSDFPEDPNAKGWVLLTTAQADSPPDVVQAIPQPDGSFSGAVPLSDRALVYPGAEAFAHVGVYAYAKGGQSVGISCGLNGIALTGRDLGRFDSKPTVGQMFGGMAGSAPPPVPGAAPGAAPAQGGYAPPAPPQQTYAPPAPPSNWPTPPAPPAAQDIWG